MIPASNTSLCPGYKQVDSFGPDEDYNDEEISYVTLDLGNIEPTLVPSSSTYRLIGLDTSTPFLQLSGTILRGQHNSLLGTELLFTDGKDLYDKTKRSLNYISNTEQRICFKEVRLQPKLSEKEVDQITTGNEDDSQIVDRVTGKIAPRARTSRPHETSKGKTKKKEKLKPKPRDTPIHGEDIDAGSDVDSSMDIY